MEMNFCRRCGTELEHTDDNSYKCQSGHRQYLNAAPCVGVFFVCDNNDVLVSVRGIEPHKGMLDAFGGFVNGEETFETTISRELNEELGLQPGDYETPQYLGSAIGHYPFGDEIVPVLSALYWSRLSPGVEPKPADDVARVRRLSLDQINQADLHDEDIRVGLRVLKSLLKEEG